MSIGEACRLRARLRSIERQLEEHDWARLAAETAGAPRRVGADLAPGPNVGALRAEVRQLRRQLAALPVRQRVAAPLVPTRVLARR